MANVKHFNGTQELKNVHCMPNPKFAQMFPGVRGRAADSFSKWVGQPTTGTITLLPVERVVTYKRFPSRHECGSKCMNGSVNGTCECSCGGANHGLGSLLSIP